MTWDFRGLIRRGGGLWPRSWRREEPRPIRAPDVDPAPSAPAPEAVKSAEMDEHWLPLPWQPPEGGSGRWKKGA